MTKLGRTRQTLAGAVSDGTQRLHGEPPTVSSHEASGAYSDGRLIELWLHGKSEATKTADA